MNNTKIQHALSCVPVLGACLTIIFLLSVMTTNVIISLVVIFLVVLSPYLLYLFQKSYRDDVLGGAISYSHALSYGVYLCIGASAILGIVEFIYYQYINTEFLADTYPLMIEQMQLWKFPAEMIEQAKVKGPPSAVAMSFQYAVLIAFIGFLVSLVTSGIVKKSTSTNE